MFLYFPGNTLWRLGIWLGMCTIYIEGKSFISRDTDEQNPDDIGNRQTHLGQHVDGLLFDTPINPGANDISTGYYMHSTLWPNRSSPSFPLCQKRSSVAAYRH